MIDLVQPGKKKKSSGHKKVQSSLNSNPAEAIKVATLSKLDSITKTVEVEESKEKTTKKILQTNAASGLCPCWISENIKAEVQIKHPELSFLSFTITDSEKPNEILGQTVIPIRAVRFGLHSVMLKNGYGEVFRNSPGPSLCTLILQK